MGGIKRQMIATRTYGIMRSPATITMVRLGMKRAIKAGPRVRVRKIAVPWEPWCELSLVKEPAIRPISLMAKKP